MEGKCSDSLDQESYNILMLKYIFTVEAFFSEIVKLITKLEDYINYNLYATAVKYLLSELKY